MSNLNLTAADIREIDTKYPVLDDNTTDAMVLGYAATEAEAIAVANAWNAERGAPAVLGVRMEGGVSLTYSPDLNTAEEVERANSAGRGWIVDTLADD